MITRNKRVCGGDPCICGTRISVQAILGHVYNGLNIFEIAELYKKYGHKRITDDDIKDAIKLAIDMVCIK